MNKGKWKPGESGNPAGRPKGSRNKDAIRERLYDVLDGQLSVKELNTLIKKLEPKDRIQTMLKMLEFLIPRYRSIEASIDKPEEDKPMFDLGLLSYDERQNFYALYNKACGSNAFSKDAELPIN